MRSSVEFGWAVPRALKIVGRMLALQVGLLLVWTAWNLRHSFVSLVLVAIALTAAVGSVAWSIRTQKAVAVSVGAVVLVTTWMSLNAFTDGLGSLTWLIVYLLFSLSFASASVLTVGIVRLLMGIGPVMRHGLLIFGGLIVALWTFVVPASILGHYTVWYFMLPAARLTVDGAFNAGYIHWAELGNNGGAVMVTVRQQSQSQTYRIWRSDTQATPSERHIMGQPTVQRCQGWNAPRFPVYSIGDVNPPCSYSFDDNPRPNPPERNILAGSGFVEFTGDDGKRVKVEW